MTRADQGLVNDLGISCHTIGHELLSAQAGALGACSLIRKAEPKRNGRVMTVIRHQVSQHRVFGARRVLTLRRSFTVSNQP
jgi:hypothetical protein